MRLYTRMLLLLAVALTWGAAAVSAQVPTAPESITAAPFLIRRPPSDLEMLTRLYNMSDWIALQTRARDIICVVQRGAQETIDPDDNRDYESCAAPPSTGGTAGGSQRASGSQVASALDLQRNHVALMWLGADAFGKPQLMRVVVHRTNGQPYSLDLPGVSANSRDGELVELFLSRSPQGRMTSLYTSTREDDPLLKELPAFIQALAGPLFATIGTIAGDISGREAVGVPAKPKLAATVKRVGLPFRRAGIRLEAVAREPLSTGDFAASASRLASSLSFSDLPRSPCARKLAATLAAELPVVTQAAVCSAATARPQACLTAFDTVLSSSFDAAVASCEGGKPSVGERSALERVDARFRELVQTGTSTSANLEVTFKNRPLSRFAFGLGSGVMARASLSRSRVTTRNGVLVADPLNRVMTTAFVNWSPAGYDAQDPRMSPAERFRVFFGGALTPDFGPAFGLNVLLVRGIGITAGGAFLFGKGADLAEIGKAPAKPDDPYKLSIARTVFVGISYSYK